MTTSFLFRSRHGTTLYFRRRVPNDLRAILGKNYLFRSLGTGRHAEAIIAARLLAAKTDVIFERLRNMTNKKLPDELETGYTVEFEFDALGKVSRLKVDATPEEERTSPFIQATLGSMSGATSPPSRPTEHLPTVTAAHLFDDFIREGTAAGRWKDPKLARHHDYEPIWRQFEVHALKQGLTVAAANSYRDEVLANPAISPTTKARNLDRVKAVVIHGTRKFGLTKDVLEALRLGKSRGREVSSYAPFDSDDLRKLFNSDGYRTNSFKKPSQFWLPLMGLYTGARIEELAGLYLTSFTTTDGFPGIRLSSVETTDGGKNKHAPRLFPIHTELINAGILKYVELVRSEGHIRLFPDIQAAERDGFGKRATDDFTKYRRSVDVGGKKGEPSRKVFHSFRSTLAEKLFQLGIDSDLSRRLTGHSPADVHSAVYLKFASTPMDRATEAINRISYGLAHPPYVDTRLHRSARNRKRSNSSRF